MAGIRLDAEQEVLIGLRRSGGLWALICADAVDRNARRARGRRALFNTREGIYEAAARMAMADEIKVPEEIALLKKLRKGLGISDGRAKEIEVSI